MCSVTHHSVDTSRSHDLKTLEKRLSSFCCCFVLSVAWTSHYSPRRSVWLVPGVSVGDRKDQTVGQPITQTHTHTQPCAQVHRSCDSHQRHQQQQWVTFALRSWLTLTWRQFRGGALATLHSSPRSKDERSDGNKMGRFTSAAMQHEVKHSTFAACQLNEGVSAVI